MNTQLESLVGEFVEILIENNSYTGFLCLCRDRYEVRIHTYMTIHFYSFDVVNIFGSQIVLE